MGYGVIKNYRRQGHGTEMLKQALPVCSSPGIKKALITCDADNWASKRVIEKCGGILESIINDSQLKVQKLRY